MAGKSSKPAPRKPRSDAQRNRERILEVAKDAFKRHGADASLDEIARQARVGAGTLYRHFPTRDALIEEVYRAEVEKLARAAGKLAETKPPLDALRAWMLLFVEHLETKQIIAPALNSLVGGASRLYAASRSHVQGAAEMLVARAIRSGDLRKDIEPMDLLPALIGFSTFVNGPEWRQSGRRLVDILIKGSLRTK